MKDPTIAGQERKSIGEYLLVRRIGGGGMGVVYEALHMRLKRRVAVKVISDSYLAKPRASRRFYREMEAAGKLEHRHIVRATDAGVADGVPYLVMEYVPGADLSRMVRSYGALPPLAALEAIEQTAHALAHIHAHGMVHRDIKPSNLLLNPRGEIKLADLGLAQVIESTTEDEEVTATGDIVGTVDYMAPEQGRDAKLIDHRSDIYSLGCCMYYLHSAAPVFRAESHIDRLIAHRSEEVPELIGGYGFPLPNSMNRLFQDLMAKDPDRRPQSVSEVLHRIEQCRVDLQEALARSAKHKAWFLGGKSLPVDAGLEITASTLLTDTPAQPDEGLLQTTVLLRRPNRLTLRRLAVALGVIALAIGAYFGRNLVLPMMADEQRQPSADAKKLEPVTADLASAPSAKSYVLNAHPGGAVFNAHFSPDGQHLVSCGSDGLVRVWDFESRQLVSEMPHERGLNGMHVIDIIFIPQTPLAVSVCYNGTATVWDWQAGTKIRQFTHHRQQVEGIAWISGTKVLTTGRDDLMYIWDASTGEVLARLDDVHAAGVRAVAVDPQGGRAITADYGGDIVLWNVEPGQEGMLERIQPIAEQHEIWSVNWIADTERVAIGGVYATGKSLLLIYDLASSQVVRQFSQLTGRVYDVRASRDGHHLFVAADNVFGWSLEDDQGDSAPLLDFPDHNDNVFSVDESPDGTQLVTGGTDGTVRIFPWAAQGSE